MLYSKTIVAGIEAFLKKEDVGYAYDEIHGTFSVEAELECMLKDAVIVLQATEEGFLCYTTIMEQAKESIRPIVGEYLHRANYGLPIGNFEFDYDSGEIHYKTYALCPEGVPTEAQMQDAMSIGLTVLDHYGDGLYQMLQGDTPAKQLMDALEQQRG